MSGHDNVVEQVRPTSTFDSWRTTTPEQEVLKHNMLRLAERLVAQAEKIKRETWPFDHARMIILWGRPGRGKTHLIEALVNYIRERDAELLRRVWLARGKFTNANLAVAETYGERPILIVDDLWAEYDSIDQLNPQTDIRVMMNFVRMVYDERRLVVVTSNFPFSQGIVEMVRAADTTGRITSRIRELVAHAGEVEVTGPDYREELARTNAEESPFEV